MIGLTIISEPTEKEIKDAICELGKMLEEKTKEEKNPFTTDKQIEQISEIHKGRLDRQGKDIFILWSKVANLEKQVFRMRELIENNEVEKQVNTEELVRIIKRLLSEKDEKEKEENQK